MTDSPRSGGFGPSLGLRAGLAALLAGDGLVLSHVRGEIGASWQRSAASGLDPTRFDVPFDLNAVDVTGNLATAARPVLEQLAGDVSGIGMSLILTDGHGGVLERHVTDRKLETRLDDVALAPGSQYAEERVGTNGIGTTLAERHPTFVRGAEHFADELTNMACAGAPISDPTSGAIAGAIDLTCFDGDASTLMLPLVRRAARDIEERLIDAAGVAERIVLQRFLRERKGTRGPVVYVTERRLIANAAAGSLIVGADEPILRDLASRVLSASNRAPLTVALSSGALVTGRGEPVVDGGSVVGVIIRLGVDGRGGPGGGQRPVFGWDSLTDTERSVTELVAQGKTNKQAAERLFLSPHTVSYHLRSIFRKLGVGSRVELVQLAAQHEVDRRSRPR